MNCRECELLLAEGERSASLNTHLADCEECRSFAAELSANAEVLRVMRDDVIPARPLLVRRRNRWLLAAAAAAAVAALAIGWSRMPAKVPVIVVAPPKPAPPRVDPPAPLKEVTSTTPAAPRKALRRAPAKPVAPAERVPAEPLLVKMLTPDPDVVIYWLIEPQEGLL